MTHLKKRTLVLLRVKPISNLVVKLLLFCLYLFWSFLPNSLLDGKHGPLPDWPILLMVLCIWELLLPSHSKRWLY